MNYSEIYNRWLNSTQIDEATKTELQSIQGNEEEIKDRFFQNLEFGTGGLRGVIGAGTNRINRYTVRKATQGYAEYIKNSGAEACQRGVVIAHDNRRFSREFCLETAGVLAANGIRAYIFNSLRTTPELSFTVRHLGAFGGIVITASAPKKHSRASNSSVIRSTNTNWRQIRPLCLDMKKAMVV